MIHGHEEAQGARYRLAMAARALHQQGIDRAVSVFHRAIGRRLQRVDESTRRLRENIRARIESRHRECRSLDSRLRHFDLRPKLARDRQRLEAAIHTLAQALRFDLVRRAGRIDSLQAKLSQLSPLRILERGYAIVTNESGQIVAASNMAPVDSTIGVRLASGRLEAKVTRRQ
jgi:exodeoxyribonuclease VII large subunit